MLSDMLSLCRGEPLGFRSVAGCSAASRVLLAWRKGKKGDGSNGRRGGQLMQAMHLFSKQGLCSTCGPALGRTLTDRPLYKGQRTRQGNVGSADGL